MRVAKSHLYIPANSERKVASAGKLSADSYILDLEDGVAPIEKAHALEQIPIALEALQKEDVWVRVNSGHESLAEIAALSSAKGIAGIWIAKAEPGEIFERQMGAARDAGFEIGVLIESAVGYVGRNQLLRPEIVSRVQIGEYDLRADMGMSENLAATEPDLLPIRLEIVASAVANKVESVVAGVSANFTDLERYGHSTRAMRALGFNGRAVIHPAQIEICNTVFSPSQAEIAAAKELIAGFDAQIRDGVGAYRDDHGNMADAATVRRARSIIESAS
jgi:citrate lyase subunit beta / citryl-CoA lyase